MSAPKPYSFGEELASSITHGIGAPLGISAVTLLAYRAAFFGYGSDKTPLKVGGFARASIQGNIL